MPRRSKSRSSCKLNTCKRRTSKKRSSKRRTSKKRSSCRKQRVNRKFKTWLNFLAEYRMSPEMVDKSYNEVKRLASIAYQQAKLQHSGSELESRISLARSLHSRF